MSISINPLGRRFAGEVTGIDLRGTVSPEAVAAIEAGMDRYAVLVFRGQDISDEQQLALSRNFGFVESSIGGNITRPDQRRLDVDFADVSNLDENHQVYVRDDRRRLFNLGNRLWHSDSSFRAIPAKYSLLSARSLPENGPNTEFADMRAAYDAIDPETQAEIESLVCEHSLMYSRGLLGFTDFTDEERRTFAPVRQVLVREHPVTGRRSLFLASHAGTIVGWPMAEARIFLRDLIEHATEPRFVYVHRWQVHDLVMWDNRQTMHRVRRFNETAEARDVRRTTIVGDGPTTSQANAS
ncbi:MAG: TauD/TfdA family dioxygenase [Pseudomonadota bacterium]|nr:TauD/TfdA family dioxygenase [Pseudomonadota bacterium]MEE3286626.1 TauD/TfdA family dioxygenase [Pseudomonadota bacterium]